MDWKSIKKKNIKNTMLEDYVIDIKKQYNLSFEEAKRILDKINHAICMKHILSSNVKTDPITNKITKIDGISFDSNGKCNINYNKFSNYQSKNKENICTIETFNGLWRISKMK